MRPAGRYVSSRFRATAQITRNCCRRSRYVIVSPSELGNYKIVDNCTPEATTPFSIDPCLNQAGRHVVIEGTFAMSVASRPAVGSTCSRPA
jgi:hypothetical protein